MAEVGFGGVSCPANASALGAATTNCVPFSWRVGQVTPTADPASLLRLKRGLQKRLKILIYHRTLRNSPSLRSESYGAALRNSQIFQCGTHQRRGDGRGEPRHDAGTARAPLCPRTCCVHAPVKTRCLHNAPGSARLGCSSENPDRSLSWMHLVQKRRRAVH